MIKINQETCVGCGACIQDCFPKAIELKDGKAVPKDSGCMECGHCVAVCPADAVTLEGYDMSEVLNCADIEMDIDPDVYLNHLKARRSIRKFKDQAVDKALIEKILDAGRYSPTGGNLQNVQYYVSQKDIVNFKTMVINKLKEMGEADCVDGKPQNGYSAFWIYLHELYEKYGADLLFFDAPTVIVISSNSPQSGCIAAAHMETMVYSLGLGMLYSGFSERAINMSDELKTYLQMKPGYNAYAVLVIGHPDVTYRKTVTRKPADVIWDL